MSKQFTITHNILNTLKQLGPLKLSVLAEKLQISRPTANKYLKLLVEQGTIQKQGRGAHSHYVVTYSKPEKNNNSTSLPPFPYSEARILNELFFKYNSDGSLLQGIEGFTQRCEKRNLNPLQKSQDFSLLYSSIEAQRNNCGLLSASKHFHNKISEVALDELFYADLYTRKEFGRGRQAEQMFFAKQHQDKKLLQQLLSGYLLQLECLIGTFNIEALVFTPPSIQRKVQVLTILDQLLTPALPRIKMVKYSPSGVIIPQKSLKNPRDRILNASHTIFPVDMKLPYKKVLLLDDFVGSGATLNESAKKLRQAGAQSVIGFACFGNLDLSYEVINEM